MSEQSQLSEQEAKDEAVYAIIGAWKVAIGKGVPVEVMAVTAINAAITDILANYGVEPTVQVLEDTVDKVRNGYFDLDQALFPDQAEDGGTA